VEDVDAIECSERTLSRLDVRLNVDVTGVVEATAIGICDGFASESLRTCGDDERSSPDADKSPIDDEFGGRCVKEIIDDVRRDLSFDPRFGVVAGDCFNAAAAANCC